MATATTSRTPNLPDLARRIAEQEAALDALRQQLDARLTDLNHRREELRAKLRDVETEIEAVAQRGQQDGKPATSQVSTPESPASASAEQAAGPALSLSELLVTLVRAAGGKPVTFVELKNQAVQRGFPTESTNLRKMVENRTYALVQRGVLRRDPTTKGFLLAQPKSTSKPTSPRAAASKAAQVPRPTDALGPQIEKAVARAKGPAAGSRADRPSLRAVLLDVLKQAGRTLSVQELAVLAKKAGYRSKSKHFKNVIWTALGNMPEVEHDPTGGYRLKKGKA